MNNPRNLETECIAVFMNDRFNRRIVLMVNHEQGCVVGSWVEEEAIMYDRQITNVELYALLFPKEN